MDEPLVSVRGTHQFLLEELIGNIENFEIPYYRRTAKSHYSGWHLLVALSILLSAATSLIAALLPPDQLKEVVPRGLLIALPIVGVAVNAFLKSFSFHEREHNREIGRIEVELLHRRALSLQASANGEDDFRKAFLEVSEDLAKLSHDQHERDVSTRRGVQGLPSK